MVRWRVQEADAGVVRELSESLDLAELTARLLVNRGIRSPEQAQAFLSPQMSDLHDPMLLPDCGEAVKQIASALENKDTIFVHGDYDVDGITSAAIWTRCLRRLGGTVEPHLPHRQKDGYGFHRAGVERAKELGASLIITCDCGISAVEVVEYAHELGMRVVVTDHHEPGARVPKAEAVVNPLLPTSQYPFPYLAGVGVTFKVARALVAELGHPPESFDRAYLDLAALGTVCDIVPLLDENRVLARHGIARIAESKKLGLRALMRVAGIARTAEEMTARDVGFVIGPRLNAAGRMDDATDALRLLLTEDAKEASEIATRLDRHNRERQREQQRIFEEACHLVESQGLARHKLLLVANEGWNAGVVGIVASKLVDTYWRPALVGCRSDGIVRGSARSIPRYDLFGALSELGDLFLTYGGHTMAAGFSFRAEHLEEVRRALAEHADRHLTDEDLIPEQVADAEVTPQEVTERFVEDVEDFRPFGLGNPEPLLLGRKVTLLKIEPTRNPLHPRVTLRGEGTNPIFGMAFGLGERLSEFGPGEEVEMLFEPTYDWWQGRRRLRWFVRAIRRPGEDEAVVGSESPTESSGMSR
ncbi:MAG: single-stranded-DNA-specific exonuclease RecJ [Fimbriimonadales bacterium]